MKTVITLIVGIGLGITLAVGVAQLGDKSSVAIDFASLHDNIANTLSTGDESHSTPSAAMRLMQTDTALCDQPYFVEVYELSKDYLSRGAESAQEDEFAELMFSHARNSGFLSPDEAEAWIEHIKAIPGQMIDIYSEDPNALDTCLDFQVAAVGPPR